MPKDELTPPYMSFGVFRSTVDQLAKSTVPSSPFDRRVLDQLSGADYGALMSGLRFLGYVDEERRATPKFRELVRASIDSDRFKEELLGTLNERYAPIVAGVDLQHGSASELEKAFRENGGVPAGQMLTKTVRFFVKALQECGIEISPHIMKAKPRTARNPSRNGASKPRRVQRVRENERRDEKPPIKDHPPQGMERMPIPGLTDAFIQYPANITDGDCDLFVQVIGVLRVYAKNRGGKAGKS
jgi:hypothetical protein